MKHEKSHRGCDDFFTWWKAINEFRTNYLDDLKELTLEIKLLNF